jgi:putative membrane protein
MDYMFQPGFLGTKAPFFMDFVTIIVAALPLLVAIAIYFAKKGKYVQHAFTQTAIFIVSIIVVSYFEYGVRLGGGYEGFIKNTSVSHDYLFVVLVIHIVISVITLGIWASTLLRARKDYESGLPGPYSRSHKRAGIRTFIGIVLTSLSGIWVYLLLFLF